MALCALFVVCLGALTLPGPDASPAPGQPADCQDVPTTEMPPALSIEGAPELPRVTPRVIPKAAEPSEKDGTCGPPPTLEFVPVPRPPAPYPRTGVGAFRPYPDCAAVGMPQAGVKMCGGVPSASADGLRPVGLLYDLRVPSEVSLERPIEPAIDRVVLVVDH